MLVEFSNSTATLLKAQLPKIKQLDWQNANTLNLTSIKQLKGCRTELVQNCLKFIQELDVFANNNPDSDKKNFVDTTIHSLIENLDTYIKSCERYPRVKDFLNYFPNYGGEGTFFVLLITVFIGIVFPPLVVLPIIIILWIGMDLFFNNREAAKDFEKKLYVAEDKLDKLLEAQDIVNESKNTRNNPSAPVTGVIDKPVGNLPSCSYGSLNDTKASETNNTVKDPETFQLSRSSSLTSTY